METNGIKFSDPSPTNPAEVNSTELAGQRRELAKKLREQFPGQWAIISEGHVSIKSAGVVRRRLAKQPHWVGFELTSRKAADGGEGYCIHGRYVGGDQVPPIVDGEEDLPAVLADDDADTED
jgi:hypothetical protein